MNKLRERFTSFMVLEEVIDERRVNYVVAGFTHDAVIKRVSAPFDDMLLCGEIAAALQDALDRR